MSYQESFNSITIKSNLPGQFQIVYLSSVTRCSNDNLDFFNKQAKFVGTTIIFIKAPNLYLKVNLKYLKTCKKVDVANIFLKAQTSRTKVRPWWPSGLERVSNSNRCSLKDPGLNPA